MPDETPAEESHDFSRVEDVKIERPDDTDRIEAILAESEKHAARVGGIRPDHVSEAECRRMHTLDARSLSNRQIGERVGYSHRTVSAHINGRCSHDIAASVSDTAGER